MLGSLSLEIRIENGLRQFQCSGRSFAAIAAGLGVQISNTQFAAQIKTGFDSAVAERLMEVLSRMASLQNSVNDAAKRPIVIDWTRTRNVVDALVIRLVAECGNENDGLDELAESATKSVTN
jgi:hypothetical protein